MADSYYYTSEMVTGNLLIILFENDCSKPVTFDEVRQFVQILSEEAQKSGIPFKPNFCWETPLDETERYLVFDHKIYLRGRYSIIDLIYHHRTYEREDMKKVLESKELEERTLKMMGFKPLNEKKKMDIDKYIKELEESINNHAAKRNFHTCLELTEEIDRIKELERRMINQVIRGELNAERYNVRVRTSEL